MKPLILLLTGIVLAMVYAIFNEVSNHRADAEQRIKQKEQHEKIMEIRATTAARLGQAAAEKAPKPAEVRVKLATWLGELKGLRGQANERARVFACERMQKEIEALLEELKFTNLPARTALREVQAKLSSLGYSGERGLEAAISMAEAQLQGLQ